MTKTIKTPVYVFRCSRCGLEYFSLHKKKPVKRCGRCDNSFLPTRVVPDAGPNFIAEARREDAARAGA